MLLKSLNPGLPAFLFLPHAQRNWEAHELLDRMLIALLLLQHV